jgi:hypothetical protein
MEVIFIDAELPMSVVKARIAKLLRLRRTVWIRTYEKDEDKDEEIREQTRSDESLSV